MKKISLLILLALLFNSCADLNKQKAETLNKKGLAFLEKNQETQAIENFQKAANLEGIDLLAQTNYTRNTAIAFQQIKQQDSAKKYYLKAARLNKKNTMEYLQNISDVYLIENDLQKAEQALLQAYALDSADMAINNCLGLLYLGEEGDEYYYPEDALKYNKTAFQKSPSRNTKYVLAKNYLLLQEYNNSEKLFKELYKEFPQTADYLIALIVIEKATDRKEEEERDLITLQTYFPEDYKSYMSTDN